ncbi:DJ-1/PfpI family protein [Chitinophaga qingshengii]|uniref:DJ-1/PfpI family protein n=1 Tax=Chitinophaga qingshengii TaxID=1569794 RepID=A0ABR7TQD8_9BACT|nr:DJ-1/PfpI family protein [Chitinophaga qingshengii]MBC9931239.1 DJ-1/PfpI family protein [Chitinophaga qingshengii]
MKAQRNCYVYVYDRYSDWEPALAVYGLNNFTDIRVIPFSVDGQPVTSGGNVSVQPQQSLEQAIAADIDLLIIPGGATIAAGAEHEALLPLVRKQLDSGRLLAAICDATVFLGNHGLLDQISHTGNDARVLQMMAPNYKGAAHYIARPAVTAGNLITAAGTAMVPFTKEIYTALGILEQPELAFWFGFFDAAGNTPQFSHVPALPFFFRSYEVNMESMLPLVRTATLEMYRQAIAAGLEVCGPVQWHYHQFDGNPQTMFRLEIGLPITAVGPVPAPYQCEVLPAFDCISTTHEGGWDKLGDTYGKLISITRALGIQLAGYNREQYFRYDFHQPDQNITNVQMGILKP